LVWRNTRRCVIHVELLIFINNFRFKWIKPRGE